LGRGWPDDPTDAFGNAIGSSLVDQSHPQPQGVGPYSDANYRNGMDIESDIAQTTGANGAGDKSNLLGRIAEFASTSGGSVLTPTAQSGGHYYLVGLVGRALGIQDERLGKIMAFSQFPDQVSVLDGATNGARLIGTDSDYEPAQAGRRVMEAVHALNGRPLDENIATFQQIIAKNSNDDAAIGIAMHGLVDSIFHAHEAPGGGMVSWSSPMGHGWEGSDPDYVTPDKVKLAAGAIAVALENVSGSELTQAQRTAAMNFVDSAMQRAQELTSAQQIRGGAVGVGSNQLLELNFRAVSAELLGSSGNLRLFSPNEIQSPIALPAINRDLTVQQTQDFLNRSSAGPVNRPGI
jgi:hypothetical protein